MVDKSYVTLEQHQCMVCGKAFDTGALLLDRKMRDRFEHHTLTGTSLCPDHQKKFDEGYIAIVEIDPEKSAITDQTKNVKPEDAYRTGTIIHVRREVFGRLFNLQVPDKCPMTFCGPDITNFLQSLPVATEGE